MIERVAIRESTYYDSVTLMLVSREVAGMEGVADVAAVTGTPLNLSLLAQQGYDLDGRDPGPNDLVIALRALDERAAEAAIAAVHERLTRRRVPAGSPTTRAAPRSLVGALHLTPELNLAFISVPGPHAAYEAAVALRGGLHVFCFSDGVGIEEEIALKTDAIERGLLFMGPDCGTAVLDGVALGFANVVARGPIGLVGASGTGLQQVMCLLDASGVGVSQVIGVGGRDLTAPVGGLGTCRALELLAEDTETEAIVVVSKPADPAVAEKVARLSNRLAKPVVFAFMGGDVPASRGESLTVADTIDEAAAAAARLVGTTPHVENVEPSPVAANGYVRGLFCGGTLCDEAMMIVARTGDRVASNIPLRPEWKLEDVDVSEGHTFIDFGEDQFTAGRAHPMIDPSLRLERLAREARDPDTGVLLLDVILGLGAHPDPAEALAPAIREALALRSGRRVIISLCGTERDPQGLARQRRALEAAGAIVVRSNAHAARLAVGDPALARVAPC